MQKLLDEAYALLKEKENEKDSLGKSMSDELARVKSESEKALNEAKTKMAIAQTEYETQVSVLTAKLQLAESKLDSEKQNIERSNKENSQIIIDLNTKLTQLQAAVDDKTLELNKGNYRVFYSLPVRGGTAFLFLCYIQHFQLYYVCSNRCKQRA